MVDVDGGAPGAPEEGAVIAAVTGGDAAAFAGLIEGYRWELQVHCYRMLGSLEDAEDQVQETLLRAWRKRETFQGRASLRAWLYRIATNTCLNFLEHTARRPRRVAATGVGGASSPPRSFAEIPWLQPIPDRLLDQAAPSGTEPDAVVVARETIELAFLAALQFLPSKQRAVLIVRDVLGWTSGETAALLGDSVAAVNSALQRARATLRRHRPAGRLEWAAPTVSSGQERVLLQRYMDAVERADAEALIGMLHSEVRLTMPPHPAWYEGREAVGDFLRQAISLQPLGDWRALPIRANRQPAVALYLRRWGDTAFRLLPLEVLRVEGGRIVEITTFVDARRFPQFDLPPTL
jgi:RNA polymerase sigma-70 factor, ECF subfamily